MRFTAPRVIVLDGDTLGHPRGACPPFAALSLALIVLDGNAFKHPWGACPPLIFRDAHPPLISTSIHPNDRRPRSPVNYKAHIPFSFPPATPSGSSATGFFIRVKTGLRRSKATRWSIFPAEKMTKWSIFPAEKMTNWSLFPAEKMTKWSIFPGSYHNGFTRLPGLHHNSISTSSTNPFDS